ILILIFLYFFFSSRRRHTRFSRDWSSDVCSSDLGSAGIDVRRRARWRNPAKTVLNLSRRRTFKLKIQGSADAENGDQTVEDPWMHRLRRPRARGRGWSGGIISGTSRGRLPFWWRRYWPA